MLSLHETSFKNMKNNTQIPESCRKAESFSCIAGPLSNLDPLLYSLPVEQKPFSLVELILRHKVMHTSVVTLKELK